MLVKKIKTTKIKSKDDAREKGEIHRMEAKVVMQILLAADNEEEPNYPNKQALTERLYVFMTEKEEKELDEFLETNEALYNKQQQQQ